MEAGLCCSSASAGNRNGMLAGRAELRPRKQRRAQWHDQGELFLVQPWAAAALAKCLNAIHKLPRFVEQAGDQLVEVDGVDIRELAPEQVGKMIMGEEVRGSDACDHGFFLPLSCGSITAGHRGLA